MARPVRIDIAGGWYHVTARGIERHLIFTDKREHVHFLEVVEGVRGEAWEQFAERHADWGRDLVLYLARCRSGLTLAGSAQRLA